MSPNLHHVGEYHVHTQKSILNSLERPFHRITYAEAFDILRASAVAFHTQLEVLSKH